MSAVFVCCALIISLASVLCQVSVKPAWLTRFPLVTHGSKPHFYGIKHFFEKIFSQCLRGLQVVFGKIKLKSFGSFFSLGRYPAGIIPPESGQPIRTKHTPQNLQHIFHQITNHTRPKKRKKKKRHKTRHKKTRQKT